MSARAQFLGLLVDRPGQILQLGRKDCVVAVLKVSALRVRSEC
jgi:hypothetical protein